MSKGYWTNERVIEFVETLLKDYVPINKNTWESKELSKEPPFVKKQHGTAYLLAKYKENILKQKHEKTL